MTTDSNSTVTPARKTKKRVKRPAKARSQSAHWVMPEEVERYVEQEEKDEKFRQDALAAWTNYQATPLYITAGEADKWLAKLGAGKDAPPPTCTTTASKL